MTLPTFKYHPDPLDTESVVKSDFGCLCCGQMRGFIYRGPVYSTCEYDGCICPWRIADGSAAESLGVSFHDEGAVPGSSFSGAPKVNRAIIEQVCKRTPGFGGWQQEEWFTCCDDAAAFLGRAGHKELNQRWSGAIPMIQDSTSLEGARWEAFFRALDRDGSPTAYVFRCLHCGRYGGYQDCD